MLSNWTSLNFLIKRKNVETLQPLLRTHCRLTDILDTCSSNKTRQQNFRLVQIESSCRPQNKYDRIPEICFSYNRKHYRKKEKMMIKSIFSTTMFSKDFSVRVVKKVLLCGKGLIESLSKPKRHFQFSSTTQFYSI